MMINPLGAQAAPYQFEDLQRIAEQLSGAWETNATRPFVEWLPRDGMAELFRTGVRGSEMSADTPPHPSVRSHATIATAYEVVSLIGRRRPLSEVRRVLDRAQQLGAGIVPTELVDAFHKAIEAFKFSEAKRAIHAGARGGFLDEDSIERARTEELRRFGPSKTEIRQALFDAGYRDGLREQDLAAILFLAAGLDRRLIVDALDARGLDLSNLMREPEGTSYVWVLFQAIGVPMTQLAYRDLRDVSQAALHRDQSFELMDLPMGSGKLMTSTPAIRQVEIEIDRKLGPTGQQMAVMSERQMLAALSRSQF